MKRFIIVYSFLLIASLPLTGQSLSSAKAQLDMMFSGLDKSKVPTGFLWDTAVNLIDGDRYNGSVLTDSNYVNQSVMTDLLWSINSASVGADTICIQAALSRIQRNSSPQNVMFGVLFQPYNYIVENALTDGLIVYSDGVVSDAYQNNNWINPYGEEVLFGFVMGNDVVNQSTAFSFSNVDSLSTQVFQSIQFDPGDGNGYRTVIMGGTVAVSYASTGYVETKLKVTVGGQLFQSHCKLRVTNTSSGQNAPQVPPPLSHQVTATYQGRTYCAKISYADSVAFHKRPLIVSEGFDPWRLFNGKKTHDYSGFTDIFKVLNKSFSSNYDVFYVDWYDCGADIRANAEVLKEVIKWVNSHNASGKPNVVLGQSMGGLIARYALRDMELNNESHNTTHYISHDVPYLGANISPGLMYTYWDLRNIATDIIGVFAFLSDEEQERILEALRLGTYTSVKQMLPLYLDSEWHYNNGSFLQFQQELDTMGFPKGDSGKTMENIAIVNGGKSPSGSFSFYDTGDKLLDLKLELSTGTIPELILSICSLSWNNLPRIPGRTTLLFQHLVYPFLNNSSLIRKTDLVFKKDLLWLLPISFNLFSKKHYAPSTGIPYDAVPGSFYDVAGRFSKDSIYYHTQSSLDSLWLGYYSLKFNYADKLSFIPTASAMSMPNTTNYYRDFYANLPSAGVDTPFTSYILQNNSSEHIDFFPGIANWLETVTQTEISCPTILLGGETATLSGNPNNDTFTWSSSPRISINSSTGQTSINENGTAYIKATYSQNGAVVTKTKYVLAGFPEETLSATRYSNGSYKVFATPRGHGVRDLMKQAVADSSLSYVWGIKEGTSDIVWQSPSSSDTLYLAAIPNNTDVFVLLKMRGWNGSESNPVFMCVNTPLWFETNLMVVSKPRHSDIVYDLFPTWSELVSDYGHDCLVFYNLFYDEFPYEPTSITMDSYTYPLTEKRTMLDGTVAFVFDVLYDQTFHDFFYEATLPYNDPSLKSLYMNTTIGVSIEHQVLCFPEQLPPQPI